MSEKGRHTERLTALGGLALMLTAGCGVPGHAPGDPAPENVVSVGYGTRSRTDVASSISSITPERIGGGRITRVERLLEGIPGLEVVPLARGDFTVRIRGMGVGPGHHAEPLLLIDDVPVQAGTIGSTLAIVPPQEIVRIDVLKDASSTAVFGMRGANGVIIVTTRRSR